MKRHIFLIAAMTFVHIAAGQGISDGLRYSQNGVYGTARFQGLSGAFGALGGDFSAMGINPAGSAVFIKSGGSISLAINDRENETTFLNTTTRNADTDVAVNQIGGVFVIQNRNTESIWKKLTIGLNYDQTQNQDNEIFVRGTGSNSIGDFFTSQAQGIPIDLLELQDNETISSLYSFIGTTEGVAAQNAFLGYQAFIFDPVDPENANNSVYNSNIANGSVNQRYNYVSSGYNGKATINVATQITDKYYLGVNLNSHSINYTQSTFLYEGNDNTGSTIREVAFENQLLVSGTGFSAQVGGIAKFNGLRIGLSFDTPTWHRISEETTQSLETIRIENEQSIRSIVAPNIVNVYEDYNLRTPGKITASAAYIFGKSALLSVDYSIQDYSNLKFDTIYNTVFNDNIFDSLNQSIENSLKAASSIKIGGEYRIANASIRGGFRYEESPYQNEAIMGDLVGFSLGGGLKFGSYSLDIAYSRAEQDRTESIYGLNSQISNEASFNNVALTFGASF